MTRQSMRLLFLVAALVCIPLFMDFNTKEPFIGADTQAETLITTIDPDYEPWFQSFWSPPGGAVESLLFALQAALGAGVLGFYLGSRRVRTLESSADANSPE